MRPLSSESSVSTLAAGERNSHPSGLRGHAGAVVQQGHALTAGYQIVDILLQTALSGQDRKHAAGIAVKKCVADRPGQRVVGTEHCVQPAGGVGGAQEVLHTGFCIVGAGRAHILQRRLAGGDGEHAGVDIDLKHLHGTLVLERGQRIVRVTKEQFQIVSACGVGQREHIFNTAGLQISGLIAVKADIVVHDAGVGDQRLVGDQIQSIVNGGVGRVLCFVLGGAAADALTIRVLQRQIGGQTAGIYGGGDDGGASRADHILDLLSLCGGIVSGKLNVDLITRRGENVVECLAVS